MMELREDILAEVDPTFHRPKVDERVIAPTEPLEDRSGAGDDYELDETLARAGTGHQPKDPAANTR